MKFHIHTTGCKANQCDSRTIANALVREGHVPGEAEDSGIIVINACTLTDGAERDIRRFMNRCRRANGGARIILAGCHAQVYPGNGFDADLVLGRAERFNIAEYLNRKGTFVGNAEGLEIEAIDPAVASRERDKTRFFFKIQDGCDRFCTYCIVPFARGKPRSRPLDVIMDIMARLEEAGTKETVLTGIELASYRDPASGRGIKDLLRLLEAGRTPDRIRLSSIDPLVLDDEFIDIMANSVKIARSLHIPLQSGSDAVLRRMGRPYTTAFIRDRVERLFERVEGIGVGMDVIVGFPSEREDLFRETYRFIEEIDPFYLHVFPFSARAGTVAASMEGMVPERTKKERVKALKALDGEKRRRFIERFTGSEVGMIPEGRRYKSGLMRGYTDNYIPVFIPYDKILENNLIKVRIEGVRAGITMGSVVKGSEG